MDPLSDPLRIQVGEECAGERLDVFLARRMPSLSRAKIQKCIADGFVLVNGGPAKKKTLVSAGDTIDVDQARLHSADPSPLTPQNIPLDIIYEDDWLLAVNKPAGIVVHPGSGNREGTLVHGLLYHIRSLSQGSAPDRPGIVHRLDKDTSGIILVAKTDEAHTAMGRLFASRSIKKQYIGICIGKEPKRHGIISLPLARSRRDPVKRSVQEGGKQAETEYRLLARHCGISVVRFSPHTGRTHQIRVHASASGFPVVCDPLYGGGKDAIGRLAVLDRPFAHRVFGCFNRHALHALSVSFAHPHTGKAMDLFAPLPADFNEALALFVNEGISVPAAFGE